MTLLKPTKTWPQRSRYMTGEICHGREGCTYGTGIVLSGRRATSPCGRLWNEYGDSLFQAFLKANPGVMFRDGFLRCIQEILPYHRCNTRFHRSLKGRPIDHAQLCRLPDGNRFIISQPYCDDGLCEACLSNVAQWQRALPGLAWVAAGKHRSWYFPTNANLLFLGQQDVLDLLNLDYPLPKHQQPDGCVRWQ